MSKETPKHVLAMVERMGLNLSNEELAEVVAIVEKTGSLAPEATVVARFQDSAMTSGVLTFFLPSMWRDREGDSQIPSVVWMAMFQHAEYTEDSMVRPRPTGTVRAYRGATEANREGLSWSLAVDQAKYFARSRQAPGVTTARVWVSNLPAERQFARYMEGWEKEVTADVRGLEIRPIEEAHLLPKVHRWWQWWR